MASKKPHIQVPVPHTGERHDINEDLRDGTMASIAQNVLFYDNAIRPRPALTKEVGEYVSPPVGSPSDAPNVPVTPIWQNLYTGDTDGQNWSNIVNINGILLAYDLDGNQWQQSVDGGENWTQPAYTDPLVNIRVLATFGANTLVAFSDSLIYTADISSFPTSIGSWTTATGTSANYWRRKPGGSIYYDETNDQIIGTDVVTSGYLPSVYGCKDVTGSPVQYELNAGGQSYSDGYHMEGDAIVELADGTLWHMWTERFSDDGGYGCVRYVINAKSLVYSSGTDQYVYGATEFSSTLFEFASQWYSGSQDWNTYWPSGVSWIEPSVLSNNPPARIGDCILDAKNYNGFIFTAQGLTDGGADSYIVRAPFNSTTGFAGTTVDWEIMHTLPDIGLTRVLGFNQTEQTMAVLYGHVADSANSYLAYMPLLVSSNDGGANWINFDEQIALGYTYNSSTIYFDVNPAADQYMLYLLKDDVGADEWPSIWEMPIGSNPPTGESTGGGGTGETATSPQGDVTSVFQIDLDDEDAAVIQGSTRGIYILDRDSGEWVRKTANSGETVDNGTADSWFDSGDIPPLSVHPDESEYVSGVTIDGTYGSNNWIFRNVEAQGKTFLLGTNGQASPICYHADMNGGFARRMGEVPPSDPNDLATFDPLDFPSGYLRTGNLAPKAKCMAVGANRVLLANLVGGSPYGIDVSGFNDPDRGWGLEQFVMLGDTPGGIVSMNEISALSIAVYKTDAIYQAVAQTEFQGVAAPFRFELSKAGVSGPCSPAAVVRNHDGRQVYLARDGGVYMYDGVAPIDVGRNIRRMIQEDIDYNNLDKVWGMVDQQRKLIWFFYPTVGGLVNKGIVCSTDQGFPWPVWSTKLPDGWNFTCGKDIVLTTDLEVGQLGPLGGYTYETLSSFSSGEQTMLMGTLNNIWFNQRWKDTGDYTDDGLPIPIKLHTGWVSPTDDETMHTADEIYHLFRDEFTPQELTVPTQVTIKPPDPGDEDYLHPFPPPLPDPLDIYTPGAIFSQDDRWIGPPLQQEVTETLRQPELYVTLKADQIGNNYRLSKTSPLYAGKLRHRTRHRVTGTRFSMQLEGAITRFFTWAGGLLKYRSRGKR